MTSDVINNVFILNTERFGNMKKFQRGVSGIVLTLIIVLLSFATLIGLGVATYVTSFNYGNEQTVLLETVYKNNQNVLGNYTTKIQEMAQVPEMYKNDLKDVVTSVMSARMGADGSKAVVQWFKEQNIPFDSSLYLKLQQTIEAGRNEFQREQTRMLDVRRGYETSLGYLWQGFWLKLAGYPKIPLDKYNPVVAPDTAKIFEDGKQAPIKLR